MKMYIRLAFSNIIKNRRLYVPHMCTGAGLTSVFYIMLTLSLDDRLKSVKGGNYLPTVMGMGVIVVGLVSVILMLYTNSFLMKRRQSEFGLYNVLGMEKRHIGRILLCETVMSGLTALFTGLLIGIVLYKLCALVICRILKVESVLGFYHVMPKVVGLTMFIFVVVYGAIYIFNLIRIAAMKPMKLLASTHEGEREPKTKWIMAVLGFVSLGAGYYIALTTQSPLKALYLFFLAVILVIVGTYFLFMAGSIVILKAMRKNKKFYYRSHNMIGISGMLYRMKQNAAGLASIAILATCVLVMMSSTVTLYAGMEDSLEKEFPHQLNVSANYETLEDEEIARIYQEKMNSDNPVPMTQEEWERYDNAVNRVEVPEEVLIDALKKEASASGLELTYAVARRYLMVAYYFDGHNMTAKDNINVFDGVTECFFITEDYYNEITGNRAGLQKDEILVAALDGNTRKIKAGDTINITGIELKVKGMIDDYVVPMDGYSLADCFGIVLADDEMFMRIYDIQAEAYGRYASDINTTVMVDFGDSELAEKVFENPRYRSSHITFTTALTDYIDQQEKATGGYYTSWRSVWETRAEGYGMLGTLMFLGILLSVVFIMATALIIYYKQVSEGYDDRERFHIMQKVGMGSDEVKSAIRSQILAVFIMPVLVAALHMSMAFPIIVKLMRILFAPSMMLFVVCTLTAFAIFCGIYIVIYILTARMYYHIVRLEA
ncbi:MAG: ABC transporter permease [Lachnospiraceae bacterium]|nr:ABC transporter permease [Lachnospiraceae bacterium]